MTKEEAKKEIRDTFTEVWADGIIKALEQEPKMGHWTYICNSEVNGLKIMECSECNKRTYGK